MIGYGSRATAMANFALIMVHDPDWRGLARVRSAASRAGPLAARLIAAPQPVLPSG